MFQSAPSSADKSGKLPSFPAEELNKSFPAPVDYTNDIHVISQIDNFISINNAIEIDLFGQANAEFSGFRHISGTGGQLDFVMGAYLSRGGKSFICLSSTVAGRDGCCKSCSKAQAYLLTAKCRRVHYN